jgi:hypothetical protein
MGEGLTTALIFVLTVNVLMFLTQAAILDVNPTGTAFYSMEGSILEEFDAPTEDGEHILDTNDIHSNLPESESSISPTTGNIFTDTFTSIKNWFGDAIGLSYLYSIISAPYNLLKSMQLPNDFVYAVGTLWYAVTLFLVVAFALGRN